jgi:hypothetical protein
LRRRTSQAIRKRRGDAKLLVLGRQFDAALAELSSLRMRDADAIGDVEAFLARMEPIERAILAIPAGSMAGVAVKARVAAHVVSNYWDVPSDRLDMDARAFRNLVEAVCTVAGASLPFPPNPARPVHADGAPSDDLSGAAPQ